MPPTRTLRTITGRSDHVVVAGAGLAGLAAALHLAGRGREVTVIERADHPGGRAGRWTPVATASTPVPPC